MITNYNNSTFNELLFQKIQFNQGELDSTTINNLIKSFSGERERMIGLYERYKGDVPIKNKKLPDYIKKNNKLIHDFRGNIIQQGVGSLVGTPISYTFDRTKYNDSQSTLIDTSIDKFNKVNNIELLDLNTCTFVSVCGQGARLLYIDINGILRTMNIKPWEVIFVYDPTIDKMVYGIIYYQVDFYDPRKKLWEKRWKIELYDDKNVTFYLEDPKNHFELDPDEPTNPLPHMFNGVPLVKFSNNLEELGDFEKVETDIDAYDLLISNAQDELDEFRLAYLGIIGGMMEPEDIVKARAAGTFQLPEGMDIKWIVKNLPTEFYANQAKLLKSNIYHLSATIDPSDPAYSGNAESGVARKLRFTQLENRIIIKERNFNKALYDQYDLITDIWSKRNIKLDPSDMIFTFGRNIPVDYEAVGRAAQLLTGQISEETKLSLFPFIKDPIEELERMQKEREAFGSLIDLSQFEVSGSE